MKWTRDRGQLGPPGTVTCTYDPANALMAMQNRQQEKHTSEDLTTCARKVAAATAGD